MSDTGANAIGKSRSWQSNYIRAARSVWCTAIGRTVQNTSSIFQGRFKQFPEYGETQRAIVYQRLERMDRELNGHQFVAGDRFTIADITALVAIDIGGRLADIKITPELAHLTRWHNAVSKRPSANA